MGPGKLDRAPGEIGHYFDQSVFDLHMTMQQWRAGQLAIEMELKALGVSVDTETGKVTVTPKAASSCSD